jgi:hypothetical protein
MMETVKIDIAKIEAARRGRTWIREGNPPRQGPLHAERFDRIQLARSRCRTEARQ